MNTAPRGRSRAVSQTVPIYIDFVLTGIVMTFLGPMLPVLSARWSLNDTQAGYLFTAQFLSSMFGMLFSGKFVEWFGYRVTLICGLIGMTIGMAMLAPATRTWGLVSVAVFGFGFGLTTPAANLLTARMNPEGSASALNLLNAFWGAGALICPLLVASAEPAAHSSYFLYGMAGALLALAAYFARIHFEADRTNTLSSGENNHAKPAWSSRWLFAIAALFFVYVGVETCVGGWIATYARRLGSGPSNLWAITPSFFWGALLAGRLGASLALRRLRETGLAKIGIAIATIGMLLLLLSQSMGLVIFGALLAGLGLASIYPINVSLLSHWFGEAVTNISGVVFSMGTLGAAILPWIVGLISTKSGSLRLGFMVPLFGSLLMWTFYLVNDRVKPSPHP